MATRKWKMLPGGNIKRWKESESESRCGYTGMVPPHWYRNYVNRRERRKAKASIRNGDGTVRYHIHPQEAAWYR